MRDPVVPAQAGAAIVPGDTPGDAAALASDGATGVLATGVSATGALAGIARHARPKGAMETLDQVAVTLDSGIAGDRRGVIKPGGKGLRQVTLLERSDWDAAISEIGHSIPWFERRANLLVEGIDLPQIPGTKLRIGEDVVLVITGETDPCQRMDALVPGLQAALRPDWRGGACSRVLAGGMIRVGDLIRVEP